MSATPFSTLQTKLNRRAGNTSGDIASAEIKAAINAAVAEINRECPFLPTQGWLTGDGSTYRFDLSNANVLAPAVSGYGFHKLMAVSIEDYGFLRGHHEGIDYIRKLRAGGSMLSYPMAPIMHGSELIFDAIIAETQMIVDSDDRDFTGSTGNWTQVTGTFIMLGGVGELTFGVGATSTLLVLLAAYMDSLTVGKRYQLKLDLTFTRGAALSEQIITATINSATDSLTLPILTTTNSATLIISFEAITSTSQIVISSSITPGSGDILTIDNVSLRESTVIIDYYANVPALSADADTLPGFLAEGWDELVCAKAQIIFGRDMSDELGNKLVSGGLITVRGDPRIRGDIGEMARFKRAVSENNELYRQTRGKGYQDFRDLGGGGIFVDRPYNIENILLY